jgi:hypothetical protein
VKVRIAHDRRLQTNCCSFRGFPQERYLYW